MTTRTPTPPPLDDALEALLRRMRLPHIRRAAPEVVLTGCGTCNIQIANGLKRPVVHPMAILRRAYGL